MTAVHEEIALLRKRAAHCETMAKASGFPNARARLRGKAHGYRHSADLLEAVVGEQALTIRELPDLPPTPADWASTVTEHAKAFGLETVAAGCNVLADMPSDAAYVAASRAALHLLRYVERSEPMSFALLVNVLADYFDSAANGVGHG